MLRKESVGGYVFCMFLSMCYYFYLIKEMYKYENLLVTQFHSQTMLKLCRSFWGERRCSLKGRRR